MKTPREILLAQHQSAQTKLDAVRREALATTVKVSSEATPFSLREFLWSLRWHAAGMSALWLCLICLRVSASNGSPMMAAVPPAKIPSPQIILTSLRENRRQISELIEARPTGAEERKALTPKPRSDRRERLFTA